MRDAATNENVPQKMSKYAPSLSAYSPFTLATNTSAIHGVFSSAVSSSMSATLRYVSRFACCEVSFARTSRSLREAALNFTTDSMEGVPSGSGYSTPRSSTPS